MRHIKFRGKNYGGIWLYGYLMPAEKPVINKGCKYRISVSPQSCDGKDKMVYEVTSDTIGQFTGLHDKNGKEVYEGDILLLPANTKVKAYEKGDFVEDKFVQRFAVVWAKQCQGYGLCQPYEAKFEAPDVVGMAAVDRMFVIGNIHDNPELLNE